MNFMLHTMPDATGVVLRVHYKSMICDVLFSQVSIRTVFRWGGHFSYMSKKILPLWNSAKIIKIDPDFPKLWSQMYCHLFMVHSVHSYCSELFVVCWSLDVLELFVVCWSLDVLRQIWCIYTAAECVFWLSDSAGHKHWHHLSHDWLSGFVTSSSHALILCIS